MRILTVILKILEMTKKKTNVVPAPPNCKVGKDILSYFEREGEEN